MGHAKIKRELAAELKGKFVVVVVPAPAVMKIGAVRIDGSEVTKTFTIVDFLTDELIPRMPSDEKGLGAILRSLEIVDGFRTKTVFANQVSAFLPKEPGTKVALLATHHKLVIDAIKNGQWAANPQMIARAMCFQEAGFFAAFLDAEPFEEEEGKEE